jgi:hypothetical protein
MELGRMAILIVVGAIVIFFLSQIILVLWKRMKQPDELREHLVGATYVNDFRQAQPYDEIVAGPLAKPDEPSLPVPEIPGQTEEEIRSPEPTQQQVYRGRQDDPESMDMREPFQEKASFGENLRHPEASFKAHPFSEGTMNPLVDSGRAAALSTPGTSNQQAYTPELAQNGGELMKGIFAYDTTEPNGFSSLF